MPIGDGGGLGLSVGIGINLTGFEQLAQVAKTLEQLQAMAAKTEAAFAQMGAAFTKAMNVGGIEATRAMGQMGRAATAAQQANASLPYSARQRNQADTMNERFDERSRGAAVAAERQTSLTIPQMPGQGTSIPAFLSRQKSVSEEELAARQRNTRAIQEETGARRRGGGSDLLAAGLNFYAGAKIAETVFHAAAKVPEEESRLRIQGYSEADIQRQHDAALKVATSMMGASTADVMTMQRKASVVLGQENVTPGLLKSLMVDAIAIGRTTGEDPQTVAQGLLRSMEARQHLTEGGRFNEAAAKRESDIITRATVASGGDSKVLQLMHTLLYSSTMSQFDSKENADKTMGLVMAATQTFGKTAGMNINAVFSEIAGGKLATKKNPFSILNEGGLVGAQGMTFRPDMLGAMQGGGKRPIVDTSGTLQLDPSKGVQENVDKVWGAIRQSIIKDRGIANPTEKDMLTRVNEVFPKMEARFITWMESEQGRAQIARETANLGRVPTGEDLQRMQEFNDPELALQDFEKSLTTLAGEAINLTGVMHGLALATNLAKNLSNFSHDHPSIAAGVGEAGLAIGGGIAARGLLGATGVTGLLEATGLVAVGPAVAVLVPAVIGATEAFKALDSWLKSHFSFFNDKGLNDIKKNGIVNPLAEPEKDKGWMEQLVHTLFPLTKMFGLPGAADQKNLTTQEDVEHRNSPAVAAYLKDADLTPKTATAPPIPAAGQQAAATRPYARNPGVPGIGPTLPQSAAGPVGPRYADSMVKPSDLRAIQQGRMQQTAPVGGSVPPPMPSFAPPAGSASFAAPSPMQSAAPRLPEMGSLNVNTINATSLIVGGMSGGGSMGVGGHAAGGAGPMGMAAAAMRGASLPQTGPGATGIGGPGGVTPAAAGQTLPNGPGSSSRMPVGVRGSAPATPFSGTNKQFYDSIHKDIYDAAIKRGMSPKEAGVLANTGAAQSSLETGYGKHVVGNNYFGIKSGGGVGTGSVNAATTEVIGGKNVGQTASFAAFTGQQSSAEGYVDFLTKNQRYSGLLNEASAGNQQGALGALGASGYATDPNYAAKVGSIAATYGTPNVQGPQVNSEQADVPASSMHVSIHSPIHLDGDEIGSVMASHIIGGGPTAAGGTSSYDSKQMPWVPGSSHAQW